MSDAYLDAVLQREAVDVSITSPVRQAAGVLIPVIQRWAGKWLNGVSPSGSFAKGTANRSGTDIDLFISLHIHTPDPLKQVHDTLVQALKAAGYQPRRQNVSIGVQINGYAVDLVPGKQQNSLTTEHSLYRRRADTWTKTNVDTHIATIRAGGHSDAIRILKLWRDQKSLDFPSFYLELSVLQALAGEWGGVSQRVAIALEYLRDRFEIARVVDPANGANVISDDLTAASKRAIRNAASTALSSK